MKFLDAHCHLQDRRFEYGIDFDELRDLSIAGWVVNGTCEDDWSRGAKLAAEVPEIIPSFGLHPWYIDKRSSEWLNNLESILDTHPHAGIGEIGLDRWIKNFDTPAQEEVFLAQLDLAAQQNRPASLHCLRAWGRMLELLQTHPLPDRGFLLHSYGGPAEMVEAFVELGAYFSFSGYFLHPRKATTREVFRQIPLDRLLIETDAPDQPLPEDLDQFRHIPSESNARVNVPGNLPVIYQGLAEIRDIPMKDFPNTINANFARLFS